MERQTEACLDEPRRARMDLFDDATIKEQQSLPGEVKELLTVLGEAKHKGQPATSTSSRDRVLPPVHDRRGRPWRQQRFPPPPLTDYRSTPPDIVMRYSKSAGFLRETLLTRELAHTCSGVKAALHASGTGSLGLR